MIISTSLAKKEAKFHDKWAKQIKTNKIDVATYFHGSTCPENRFLMKQLGTLRGKKVLELGCGAGENSVYFATKGADCMATDISSEMLKTARSLASRYEVKIKTKVVDATNLPFAANSFDIVYAANVLHHVDIDKMLKEAHRVLKPGGKLCSWDPLIHNPVIQIYRRLATKVRSEDEHPLNIKVINQVATYFKRVKYDTFWLATLWIFIQFFLFERVNPNQERYWKKIIEEEARLKPQYLKLEKIDFLLKRVSWLKKFCWNIAIVATK